MEDLDFYFVDTKYVKHLYNTEMVNRGFSRVPDLSGYAPSGKQKFFCGILLEVDNKKYVAPVTSYKKQQSNNTLIKDQKGNVVSSLRYNFMLPVYDEVVSKYVISTEKDKKYRTLLNQEYQFCRANQDDIRSKAEHTYNQVVEGKDAWLCQNSCDFKLLEQAMDVYIMQNSTNSTAVPTPQISPALAAMVTSANTTQQNTTAPTAATTAGDVSENG